MGYRLLQLRVLHRLPTIPTHTPLPTSKADITFLLRSAAHTPTTLHPKGHITAQDNTQQLAELHDLSQAGAICFSNHKQPIDDPHLLLLALQYARGFDGLVESFPIDPQLAVHGVMHEGRISTSIGLTGIPNLAEEIRIRRDLAILSYTCLLYTSPSPRDGLLSRMPSSA